MWSDLCRHLEWDMETVRPGSSPVKGLSEHWSSEQPWSRQPEVERKGRRAVGVGGGGRELESGLH